MVVGTILRPIQISTDLRMEVGSSSGSDKNRVYELSNTTTDNLRATRSVSTVGSSQSVSSTQSKEFVALQQHMTHLTEKCEQLSANYEQHIAHLTEKYE
jgi:predicted transcriptional regulator